MIDRSVTWRVSNALVLVLLPIVVAHGDSKEMEMVHGSNTTHPAKDHDYTNTYFAHSEHSGVVYTHIALMVLSWVFILPIAVMLSLAGSRYTLPTQLIFLVSNTLGVLLGIIYNTQTPDLYPNNAHHKIGWIVTWVVCAQVLVTAVGHIAGTLRSSGNKSSNLGSYSFLPAMRSEVELASDRGYHDESLYRASDECRRYNNPSSPSLRSDSVSTLNGIESPSQHPSKEYEDDQDLEGLSLSPAAPRGTLARRVSQVAASRVWKILDVWRKIVDRIILPFGFIALATGIATFGRFFERDEIFNGLAHWIKGGVFFWLGIFTLGRWSGSFGELGWAWNVCPRKRSQEWRPSAEFVESFLIFFYGSTNIFMEHLGGWGGAWTAQDLEHISITVLFLGGGLCGMLIESTRIRNLLNTTVQDNELKNPHTIEETNETEIPDTYEFSLNPIPALVIMLLGLMMSSHTQHTMMSSMIHKQWGNLLLGASLARGLTYFLMFLKPPKSIFPSRPPTELLASFGLISGGIVFMASSTDTVNGMVHYELDAMFMYTVTMGLVGLLMAWIVIVLAIKGWAVRLERRHNSK
ncbi:hypothetical protein FLONG3_6945 [Fusarium longipes]|uniref:Integral membrane n=1 Tax=Fusarium longipes TaxID=694270 RepID=A0A395SHH4_9HYPO|nr:hypothetical protein FLONG3_6945 [Fusarium longipes]